MMHQWTNYEYRIVVSCMKLYVYLIATILHDQITKIGISKLFILVHGAGLASWLFLSPDTLFVMTMFIALVR